MNTLTIPWHLFLVSDRSRQVLISAESESAAVAEELATSGALDSWGLDPEFLGAEYLGIVDRDINILMGA